MGESLKDSIREEFKAKMSESEINDVIEAQSLDKDILVKSLEALLPDTDWKDENGTGARLIRKNSLKLINNLRKNLRDEN